MRLVCPRATHATHATHANVSTSKSPDSQIVENKPFLGHNVRKGETVMQYPIIVKAKSTNQFEAEPMGIPELRTIATTEADALEKVTQVLGKWFTSAKVVQIEVQESDSSNPWLKAFGRSADDPDFDDFVEKIQQERIENP